MPEISETLPVEDIQPSEIEFAIKPKHLSRRSWVLISLIALVGAASISTQVQAFSLSSLGSTLSSGIGGAIEQAGGKVVGGAAKGVDSVVSHLPFGLGGLLEGYVNQYVSLVDTDLGTWTNQLLGKWLGGVVKKDTGVLGASDPIQSDTDIGKSIGGDGLGDSSGVATAQAQKQDVFNQNPVAIQQSLDHANERSSATAIAEPLLGVAGQKLMQTEMTDTQTNVQGIQQLATQAQGMDVTQDVMKNLTAMVSGQSQLEAGNYLQLMQINQQAAQGNVLDAAVSESADEANRAHHAEDMAGAYGVMEGSANVYLPGVDPAK
jgi:hypothetical protein